MPLGNGSPLPGCIPNVRRGGPTHPTPPNQLGRRWDEFDGLDTGKWTLETGRPSTPGDGVQTFTASPANVAVANGNLSITAVKVGP